MVRSGLALYGYCLPVERDHGYTEAADSNVRAQLQPVMTWKTRVIGIREIAARNADRIRRHLHCARPMRLALLPVGYADGLRRELFRDNERRAG